MSEAERPVPRQAFLSLDLPVTLENVIRRIPERVIAIQGYLPFGIDPMLFDVMTVTECHYVQCEPWERWFIDNNVRMPSHHTIFKASIRKLHPCSESGHCCLHCS